MTVSVIIVNYNGLHYTRQCLESFFRYHNVNSYEVIVVDNHSSDDSQKELPILFPTIKLITLSENRGFGSANNEGAKRAKGKYLFFVNNDTMFSQETVYTLSKYLEDHRDVGIVGPRLLNEDLSFQYSFGKYPTLKNEYETKQIGKEYSVRTSPAENDQPLEKDWVTGAALMIRRELFESVHGFDERFFMYFEDIDLCKRVKHIGLKSMFVSIVSLIHFGGKSYQKKDSSISVEYRRSQLRFYDKHQSVTQRMMVRVYLVLKYLPKFIGSAENNIAKNIIRLVFHKQN